ncbi:Acid sugar phosphatase [bioreactor metagenome]|uniref:Acid sugar phosphatase n=1 Tax=bioreactor metagenome TaxID=1076179 RepID=A0A645ERX0_9ZZZZ
MFLTNNSARDAGYYAAKLSGMGFPCAPESILTSGAATAQYLQCRHPNCRVFILGTQELKQEFLQYEFIVTEDQPDVVVLGFDLTINYDKLAQACHLIRTGTPFIATHPDLNCPVDFASGYIPDCGAIAALITASTGVKPKVIGKPQREMIEALKLRKHYAGDAIAMVGDRIYTDIAMANSAGLTSILVLSGETKEQDLLHSSIQPDYVVPSLAELLALLRQHDSQAG